MQPGREVEVGDLPWIGDPAAVGHPKPEGGRDVANDGLVVEHFDGVGVAVQDVAHAVEKRGACASGTLAAGLDTGTKTSTAPAARRPEALPHSRVRWARERSEKRRPRGRSGDR